MRVEGGGWRVRVRVEGGGWRVALCSCGIHKACTCSDQ